MTENEKNLTIQAINSYIELICAGEVIGTDEDIDGLLNAAEKINNI